MSSPETGLLTHPLTKEKEKSPNIFKRAKRKVKKVTGTGSKEKSLHRRPSANPVSLAASEALHAYRKSSKLSSGDKKGSKGDTRLIGLNQEIQPPTQYTHNGIKTAKYNVVTFLPIFLVEMFSRAAYLYFLAQAGLSWWSTVSPFGGTGSTLALAFVLVVAGVKAVWEDVKRHQEDIKTNKSRAHLVNADGSTTDVTWKDVRVGQVIQVKDDELFPADLLCLYSALPDRVCFIKTTNLDGESNLKIRRPVDLGVGGETLDPAAVMRMQGTLQCEPPNANLHQFQGRFQAGASSQAEGKQVAVTMNEMLLRGCTLRNTGYVLGLVVYTGGDSRIQMNAAKTPSKVGSYDHFLNFQIGFVIIMQLAMCIFCAVASLIWRDQLGYRRAHLALNVYTQGNVENDGGYTFLLLITFWILYSYLVPISLFVTMEIVKFWQGFIQMQADDEMYDEESKEHAKARNTNLNEDLGKVDYIFSDKTGTLTSNEMQLREIAVKGVSLGNTNVKLEEIQEPGPEILKQFDERLAAAAAALKTDEWLEELVADGGSTPQLLALASSASSREGLEGLELSPDEARGLGEEQVGQVLLGHHMLDFWINLCVCHSLIVEDHPSGRKIYQGPSPDEVALVEGGKQLGFEFLGRTLDGVHVRILGVEATFQILNIMDFSSDRGRMSVIARCPSGRIRLFCKGADTKVLSIVSKATPPSLLQNTDKNMHLFATQGLRTLALGSKVLEEEEWAAWDARYQEAAADLDDRDQRLAALYSEAETNLELVGVTAIEDKLQLGVPEAIHTLLQAGIKVWVITGDKQETAINIAISCKLIRNPDSLLICNETSQEAARERLQALQAKLRSQYEPLESNNPAPHAGEEGGGDVRSGIVGAAELVIDGGTLSHILGTPEEQSLARVGAQCGSVVICRSSPAQKAAVVRMMMEYEMAQAEGGAKRLLKWYRRQMKKQAGRMLAIGDGANDVAMIQAADVGIGIMGKEGRQAVNNSDYAIAQFRFLVRLLLVHGTLSAYRLSRLIKYSFYKNIIFGFVLFYYQFYNGYSGQALVDGITSAAYNVAFTSIPILIFAVLDRPVVRLSTLMRFPQTYNLRSSLTTKTFWKNSVLTAVVDAAICFFLPYYTTTPRGTHNANDIYSVGHTVFVAMLGTVTLEVALVSRYWTKILALFIFLSYAIVYPYFVLYPLFEEGIGTYDVTQYGVAYNIFANPSFWFIAILCNLICFGHRFVERGAVWLFRPQDLMILAEFERQEGYNSDLGWQTRSRLDVLSSKGKPQDAQATNGIAHNSPSSGLRAEDKANSLLDPTIELSDSSAYHQAS